MCFNRLIKVVAVCMSVMHVLPRETLVETNSTACSNTATRNERDLKEKYCTYIENDIDETFYLQPELFNSWKKHGLNSDYLIKPYKHTALRALLNRSKYNRKCPKDIDIDSRKQMETSTCPSYLEYSYDTYRYPQIMVTSKCKCNTCLYTNTKLLNQTDSKTEIEFIPTCKQVITKRKVLRQKLTPDLEPLCNKGGEEYEFVNSWENVSVGCTCVMKRNPNKIYSSNDITNAPPSHLGA